MNALFKLMTVLVISSIGLFCCSQLFDNSGDTESSAWQSLSQPQVSPATQNGLDQPQPARATDLELSKLPVHQHAPQPIAANDLSLGSNDLQDNNLASLNPQELNVAPVPHPASQKRVRRLPVVPDPEPEYTQTARQGRQSSLPVIQNTTQLATHVSNQFYGTDEQLEIAEAGSMVESIKNEFVSHQRSATHDPMPSLESHVSENDMFPISEATSVSRLEASNPVALHPEPGVTHEPSRAGVTSPIMEAPPIVEERARERIVYGKSLARRGSIFAARQEFIQALHLVAESHDIRSGGRYYTQKLASGLKALEESDDFIAIDSRQQIGMNIETIVETHTTKIIDPRSAAELTPRVAVQRYYAYSAEQMMLAIGNSAAASEALHSLGKLLTTVAQFDASGKPLDRTKAMVMHHVAMSADPSNHLSANELGVLMAYNGRWDQASELFAQSISIQPSSTSWKNLAQAHRELAKTANSDAAREEQNRLARLAINESSMASQQPFASGNILPESWSSPQDFSHQAAMPGLEGIAGTPQPAPVAVANEPNDKKNLLNRLKKMF